MLRVELNRTRKKGDALLPFSQLELTLGLAETRPARLPQLFLQLRGDLRFRLQRLGRALTLALRPAPLQPGDDRKNRDRGHDSVTNALLDLFAPPPLRDARANVFNLFLAERRFKVAN